MSHTPLMLSALATSAVPGLQPVSAQAMSLGERNAALVHDVHGAAYVVSIPGSDAAQALANERIAAMRALTEGLRSRLSFAVPRVVGVAEIGGRTLSVTEYLPGHTVPAKSVTPVLASALGTALAEIHQLPTSSLADHQRPHNSALDALRDAAGIVDKTAATGLLPQSLLRRWEAACEDRGLWQFEATTVHARMNLNRFLVGENRVLAVTGWRGFHVGDPARDLSWLTTPASAALHSALHSAYHSARSHTDRWVMQRARLWAELDVAKWLLYGQEIRNDTIVSDATEMLVALNDRVSGDLESALTQPVSQHPATP